MWTTSLLCLALLSATGHYSTQALISYPELLPMNRYRFPWALISSCHDTGIPSSPCSGWFFLLDPTSYLHVDNILLTSFELWYLKSSHFPPCECPHTAWAQILHNDCLHCMDTFITLLELWYPWQADLLCGCPPHSAARYPLCGCPFYSIQALTLHSRPPLIFQWSDPVISNNPCQATLFDLCLRLPSYVNALTLCRHWFPMLSHSTTLMTSSSCSDSYSPYTPSYSFLRLHSSTSLDF